MALKISAASIIVDIINTHTHTHTLPGTCRLSPSLKVFSQEQSPWKYGEQNPPFYYFILYSMTSRGEAICTTVLPAISLWSL